MKNSGIVLKNYLPAKHKVAILSDNGERFDAVASDPALIAKLRPGYRITYTLSLGSYFAKLANVEIIFVPKAVNYDNLQFLHQVLELCVLAIPEGQIASEVIDLLKLLSNSDTNSWAASRRRLFVGCFLGLLGFYPELEPDEYELVCSMSKISMITVVEFIDFKIDQDLDNLLTRWIVNFVNTNVSPQQVSRFTTVYQR